MNNEQGVLNYNIIVDVDSDILTVNKKTRVFAITGSPQAGKDTFVNFVKTYYPQTINFSSVDYIRWISEKFFNLDCNDKNEKYRRFLSGFKQLLTDYNDFPFEQCASMIEDKDKDELLFLHIRELSEIVKLKERYPELAIIYVDNDNDKVYGNASDDETKNVFEIADLVIHNYDGLEELSTTAKDFVKWFVM